MTAHSSGLGTIATTLGLQKSNLMTAAKLGLGATGGITLSELVQSRVLVRANVPIIPTKWAPLFHVLFGLVGGSLVRRQIDNEVGLGVIAGGVGLGVSALLGTVLSRTMAASAAQGAAAESAGAEGQAVSGFGLGRAFAPGVGSLGRTRAIQDPTLLFGVGTPDMSAAGMFSGATTAIEETTGLSGANVAIEDSNFAAAFS